LALQQSVFPWYALKVNKRSESVATNALKMRGFEVFSPTVTERRLYADRTKNVEVPVLSGYVLIRWSGLSKNDVLSTPAVQYLVSFGGSPAVIGDQEIANIQRLIAHGGQPVPYLAAGDRVRVETGALAGMEGVYLRRARAGQLVVSIELIERSVALHVDEELVRPLGSISPLMSSASALTS
jgi:transcription antitermination factor NusG